LRPGNIRQTAIEDLFKQRIATRNSIADDKDIGRQRDLIAAEALDQLDAGGFKLRTHRRIDVGIATGDTMTGGTGKLGDPAHEGPADAEDMNMHETIPR